MRFTHQKTDGAGVPRRNGMVATLVLICFAAFLVLPAFAQDFGYYGGSITVPGYPGTIENCPSWISIAAFGTASPYYIIVSENILYDGISPDRKSTRLNSSHLG